MADSESTIQPDQPPPGDFLMPWQAPPIERTPPRPAPTEAYSWRGYNPSARLLYIRNHDQANMELTRLVPENGPLGFDLEWKPTFTRGAGQNRVALVQLANHNTILLLQISAMKEFPIKLAEILTNPDIVKGGVAIQSDAKKLFNDFGLSMRNCVDLSLLARTADNARWQGRYNSSIGLAHLIESYEYKLLPKGKITRSNWEACLDTIQLEYASNDAHAGYILYTKLEGMIPSLPAPPESLWYSFNVDRGLFVTPDGVEWHAINPNYDPGPPPPPRLPREPKSDNESRKEKRKDNREQQGRSGRNQFAHRFHSLGPPAEVAVATSSTHGTGHASHSHLHPYSHQQHQSYQSYNPTSSGLLVPPTYRPLHPSSGPHFEHQVQPSGSFSNQRGPNSSAQYRPITTRTSKGFNTIPDNVDHGGRIPPGPSSHVEGPSNPRRDPHNSNPRPYNSDKGKRGTDDKQGWPHKRRYPNRTWSRPPHVAPVQGIPGPPSFNTSTSTS